MRLDKYLKVSRLIKRRTVANEACGMPVLVNEKIARASYDVKVGRCDRHSDGDRRNCPFGWKRCRSSSQRKTL